MYRLRRRTRRIERFWTVGFIYFRGKDQVDIEQMETLILNYVFLCSICDKVYDKRFKLRKL